MRARDNPFAADRIERIRYRFTGASLDELLARLEEMNYRAAIIGPEGSGKTTLLEDLRQALERRGLRTKLLFVNDASPSEPQCRRFLSELIPRELVLLDGADVIRRSSWSLLRRHTITHAAGLTPQAPAIPPALLDNLHTRHKCNLRACLRELYDLYTQSDRI